MDAATQLYRDLRYVRVGADDLGVVARFMGDVFGLQLGESDDENLRLRSDLRNYSICFTNKAGPASIALTVGSEDDLASAGERLEKAGYAQKALTPEECLVRQVKRGLVTTAPNGVAVEIVWRHLTSGWRFFGARDAGVTGLESVALSATDVDANQRFWTKGLGLRIADWVGDAVFLALDDCHHRVAIYPSDKDGLLGVTWSVESKDNVMVNAYHFQKVQVPVVVGPDRQPASRSIFVTARAPNGLLVSYAAETEAGPHLAARGPRQFADIDTSHRAWGSPTEQPEFQGRNER